MVRLSNTPRARLRGLLVFTIAVAQAAILLGPARYTLSLAEDVGAAAKSTPAPKPKSIQLEGQGALVPTGSCSQTDCAGEFTASLTAPLFGYSNLDFDLDVSPNPVAPGSSCYQSTGDGALGDNDQFNVGFAGQLCTAFYTYTLQGTLEVAPPRRVPCAAKSNGGNPCRLRGGPPERPRAAAHAGRQPDSVGQQQRRFGKHRRRNRSNPGAVPKSLTQSPGPTTRAREPSASAAISRSDPTGMIHPCHSLALRGYQFCE